jgi:hypothetical protein
MEVKGPELAKRTGRKSFAKIIGKPLKQASAIGCAMRTTLLKLDDVTAKEPISHNKRDVHGPDGPLLNFLMRLLAEVDKLLKVHRWIHNRAPKQ